MTPDRTHYETVTISMAQLVEIQKMISDRDVVLQQALYLIEAWDRGCDKDDYYMDTQEAIAAIKEVLK